MNRHDDRARLVFHYAREEGNRLGHAMVGPEHLLLGLMREEGDAAQILGEFGASLGGLRGRVEDTLGRGSGNRLNDAPDITPRARRVMELASSEARSLSAGVVSTEHILLGIIREGDGVAYRILQELTKDVQAIRRRVIARVQDGLPPAQTSAWKEQVRVQFSHTPQAGDARPARDQLLDIIHADYAVPEGQDPVHLVARMLRAGHDPEVVVLLADVIHAWLRSGQLDDDRCRALIDLLVHWAVR